MAQFTNADYIRLGSSWPLARCPWDSLKFLEDKIFPGNRRQFTLEVIASSHPVVYPETNRRIYPGPLLPSTHSFIYSNDPSIAEREREFERFCEAYTSDLVTTIGLGNVIRITEQLALFAQEEPNSWLVSEHVFYNAIREWIYGNRFPKPIPNAPWYIDSPANHRREARIMGSMPPLDLNDPSTSLLPLEVFEKSVRAISGRNA